MAAQFSALQRGLGAIESVMDIVDQEREVHDLDQEPVAVSLRRPIALQDIHFNYPQRPDVPVLQGFSMRVEPGQQIALVGSSGAGKSTVAAMLLRFHAADQGTFNVGDEDVATMDLRYQDRAAGETCVVLEPRVEQLLAPGERVAVALVLADAEPEVRRRGAPTGAVQ